MKLFTHYLGMELQYVAYIVSLWNEAGRPCSFQIMSSDKSDLIIVKIKAREDDYITNALINKINKSTRCKLESREIK